MAITKGGTAGGRAQGNASAGGQVRSAGRTRNRTRSNAPTGQQQNAGNATINNRGATGMQLTGRYRLILE